MKKTMGKQFGVGVRVGWWAMRSTSWPGVNQTKELIKMRTPKMFSYLPYDIWVAIRVARDSMYSTKYTK